MVTTRPELGVGDFCFVGSLAQSGGRYQTAALQGLASDCLGVIKAGLEIPMGGGIGRTGGQFSQEEFAVFFFYGEPRLGPSGTFLFKVKGQLGCLERLDNKLRVHLLAGADRASAAAGLYAAAAGGAP